MDLKRRILRGLFGQRIYYRYIKPPGAYCKNCGKRYTNLEWGKLPKERYYPQYKACKTICECGSSEWNFVG